MSPIIEVQTALIEKIFESYSNPFRKLIEALPGIGKRAEEKRRKDTEEVLALLKQIGEIGVPIETFDQYLANNVDRRLKQRYGAWFLLFTFFFTSVLFALIVLNSVYEWKISEIAITGLIIEIPIQFIGILYLIAKNLFPGKIVKEFTKEEKSNI